MATDVFKLEGRDGKIYPIEASSIEEAESVLDSLVGASETTAAPEKKGFFESFAERGVEAAKGLGSLALEAGKAAAGGPMSQATFLPNLAKGMYEGAAADREAAIARQFEKDSPLRTGIAAIPLAGPYVMNAVSDIEEGKGAEVAGRTAFDALTAALPTKPGMALASRAAKGTKGAAHIAKDAAVGAYKGVKKLNAGDMVISGIANAAGPQVASAVATFMLLKRTMPGIAAEVRKGWMKRNPGASGATVEGALNNMSPDELAKAIDEVVPEAKVAEATAEAPTPKSAPPPPATSAPKVTPDGAPPKSGFKPKTQAERAADNKTKGGELAEALGQKPGVAPEVIGSGVINAETRELELLLTDPYLKPGRRRELEDVLANKKASKVANRTEGIANTLEKREAAAATGEPAPRFRHPRDYTRLMDSKEPYEFKLRTIVEKKWLSPEDAKRAVDERWSTQRFDAESKKFMEGDAAARESTAKPSESVGEISGYSRRPGESHQDYVNRLEKMVKKD